MIPTQVILDFVQYVCTQINILRGKKNRKIVLTHNKKQPGPSFVHQPSSDPSSNNLLEITGPF
jgi:hypothetical protein